MAVRKIKRHSKKILVFALAVLLVGAYLTVSPVRAGDATNLKDTLSDSRPSVVSNHDIQFTTPGGLAAGDTITVTFPSGFAMGSVAFGDMDLRDDGVDVTLAATCTSTTWGAAVAGQVVTFTSCTGTMAAASVVRILIGTNAASGVNQITNSTAAVYSIVIGGKDTGTTKIAVIAGVTVSATIAEALTFTIAGQSAANCPNTISSGDTPAGTEITTGITATAMPFATINSDAFYFGCQVVDVDTNASDGYSTTVKQLDQLSFGTTEIADGACDGTCSDTTATAWATATNNGFGYCMDDVVGDPAVTADATGWATANQCDDATPFFKTVATNPGDAENETPQGIMSSAVAESGDQANVGYKISAGAAQTAGVYTNTLVFVTTPAYD